MPFRSNFFGDKIAQPGTTFPDIDDLMLEKGVNMANIGMADLFTEGDDEFKFGGTLYLFGEDMDGDQIETSIEFDGFESKEAARKWLENLDGPSVFSISEVS